MTVRRFFVLGCSVLASSEQEAIARAMGRQACAVAPRTASCVDAVPPTLRSGYALTPAGRPIFVECV